MAIADIKVAQRYVLLELPLRASLMISDIPVQSANCRVGKHLIWGVPLPFAPP